MFVDWMEDVSLDGDEGIKEYEEPKSKLQRIIEIIFE